MNPHKLPDEQTTRTRWTLDGPYSPEFEEAWKARVRRDGNDPKRAGWKAWVRTIRAGADPELLARRIREYRAWCEDRGHAGTERAMRFSTFLGPDAPWEQDWAVKLRLDRLDSEQRRRERALRHGRDPDAPPELFDPPEPTRRPAEGQAAEDAREFLERFERARSEREPDDDDPGGDEEESDGDPTARRPAGGGA